MHSLVAGLVTSTEDLQQLVLAASGVSLVLSCSQALRMPIGCFAVGLNSHALFHTNGLTSIVLARIFNGIGTGILNAITPVWATETASHTSRGSFVAMEFTLNIFGVVVAYWLE